MSGSWNGAICVWHLETGLVISWPTKEHTAIAEIYSVSFSLDGKNIVSISLDSICIWNAETGDIVVQSYIEHIESVSISSDSKLVVSGFWDKTVCVWNAGTGNVLSGPFEGHTGVVKHCCIFL